MEEKSILQGKILLSLDSTNSQRLEVFFEKALRSKTGFINQDNVAIPDERITFGQLDKRTNRIARQIRTITQALKESSDVIIGVSVDQTWRTSLALFSILKAGAAYLPLDPLLPEDRIQYLLEDSKAVAVIYDDSSNTFKSGKLSVKGVYCIPFEDLEASSTTNSDDPLSTEEKQPCSQINLFCLMYTSGSTGIPKGVCLSHNEVYNRLVWQWKEFPYREKNEVCCCKTSLPFVDSIAEIFAPLLQGVPIVPIPKQVVTNCAQFLNVLEKYQVSRLVLVPSMLRAMLTMKKLTSKKLHYLRFWVCSGETLIPDLAEEFFQQFPEYTLCNYYGCTEVMADATFEIFHSLEDLRAKTRNGKLSIGRPIANTFVFLTDKSANIVSSEAVGEMCVGGSCVAQGYLRSKEADDAKFTKMNAIKDELKNGCYDNRVFKTGDMGTIWNGMLFYEGRLDSMVKVRGHRVDLSEIQKAVKTMPGVGNAITLCHNIGQPIQTIVTYIEKDGLACHENAVKGFLEKNLPSYMASELVFLDKLPLLPSSGKIDRQALKDIYNQRIASRRLQDISSILEVLSVDDKEKVEILLEVVAISVGRIPEKLDLDKSFYEIGGNSLNTVLALSLLSERGFYIRLPEFLACKNLKEIVSKIRKEAVVSNNLMAEAYNVLREGRYRFVSIKEVNMVDASRMFADSFTENDTMDKLLSRGNEEKHREQYMKLVQSIWEECYRQGLSFAVIDSAGALRGVSLNVDFNNKPSSQVEGSLQPLVELLQTLQRHAKKNVKLPTEKGKILHNYMMVVDANQFPAENVHCIVLMELEILKRAQAKGFDMVITTNSSALTQQVCQDLLGYKELVRVHLNEYVAPDGSRPFAEAADGEMVSTALLSLKSSNDSDGPTCQAQLTTATCYSKFNILTNNS